MWSSLPSGLLEKVYRLAYEPKNLRISKLTEQGLEGSLDENFPKSHEAHLRTLLRATPWWVEGHLRLGTIALWSKNTELAFVSFSAVSKLRPTGSFRATAQLGLSKAWLMLGDYQRALENVERLPSDLQQSASVSAQLAACRMGLEQFDIAAALLQKIRPENRTQEIELALQYAIQKASPAQQKV